LPHGQPMNETRLAAGQDHEVRYEADRTGASKEAAKKSVKAVGNSRKKVETSLEKRT
jgi:Protein of unknown function (DUF3606)